MILKFNGNKVEGFSKYSIMSTMNSLSDVFACSCVNAPDAFPLQAGIACEVFIETEKKITGGIDTVHVDSKTNMINWRGRDKTRDLIDSNPIVSTGEWKGLTAKEIITQLASPFGITVTGEDGKTFTQFNAELDAQISDIIAELCSVSGILATSTIEGNIQLIIAQPEFASIILEEGRNVKDYELLANDTAAFAEHILLGQQTFIGNEGADAVGVNDSVAGNSSRPKRNTIISPIGLDYDLAASQAAWIAREQESLRESVKIILEGHLDLKTNTLIPVDIPSLRIESKRMIEAITWKYTKGEGTTTELILVNPSKYGEEEEPITGWMS